MKWRIKQVLDSKLAMVGQATLFDLVRIHEVLESEGISYRELGKYLRDLVASTKIEIQKEHSEMREVINKLLVCPDCGAAMVYSTHYDGPIKTRFSCTRCELALDSEKSIGECFRELRRDDVIKHA